MVKFKFNNATDPNIFLDSIAQSILAGTFKHTKAVKRFFEFVNGLNYLNSLVDHVLPEALTAQTPLRAFKNILKAKSFKFLIKHFNPVKMSELLLNYLALLPQEKRLEGFDLLLKGKAGYYLNSKDVSNDFLIQLFERAPILFPEKDDREALFDKMHGVKAFQRLVDKNDTSNNVVDIVPAYIGFLSGLKPETASKYYSNMLWSNYGVSKTIYKSGMGIIVLNKLLTHVYSNTYNHDQAFMKDFMSLWLVKKLALSRKVNNETYGYQKSDLEKLLAITFDTILSIESDEKRDGAFSAILESKVMGQVIDQHASVFIDSLLSYIGTLPDADAQIAWLDKLLMQRNFVLGLDRNIEAIMPKLLVGVIRNSQDPARSMLWLSERLMPMGKTTRSFAKRFIEFSYAALPFIADKQGMTIAQKLRADLGLFTKNLDQKDILDGSSSAQVLYVTSSGIYTTLCNVGQSDIFVCDVKEVLDRKGTDINAEVVDNSNSLMELLTEAYRHFNSSMAIQEQEIPTCSEDFGKMWRSCPYGAERDMKFSMLKNTLAVLVVKGIYKGDLESLQRISVLGETEQRSSKQRSLLAPFM